eukprot:GFUD01008563.1.p1 GENE.GFUD01008563.1~~GFUD01008563.1.p1  ORF type:complete len:247 (-),score=29.41 GFUD01008563.1:325-1065(-)
MTVMEHTEDMNDENGVYIVIESEEKSSKQRYKRKSIKIMSILHLICGGISFLVEMIKMFATLDFKDDEPIIALGEGFYCGFIFLVTGLIGITSLTRTNSCKICSFLVLSIFSSIFGGFLFIMSVCILPRPMIQGHTPGIVMHSVLIICGFFELVLGIVSSSFSCHACCSCCGGGSNNAGGNSVVYIATPGEADVGKPRVVHLNMNELRKTTNQIGDKQIVLTRKETQEENPEGNNESHSKGYARFQ